jgi:exonuclease VII small subunit
MSEDFTQKLPKNGNDDSKILTAIENLETHVTKIDNRLQSLEKKVDERLHDTRPIWHKVVADIGELQSGQKRLEEGQKHLEEGQQALRSSMIELNSAVRDVSRDHIIINDVMRRLQMDFHSIDERLYKLTLNRNQPNSST